MDIGAFVAGWGIAWAASLATTFRVLHRSALRWILPLLGLALLAIFPDVSPALRLLASSLLFLYLIKGGVVASVPPASWRGLDRLLFFTVWPGMDPERFAEPQAPYPPDLARRFAHGLTCAIVGVVFTGLIALFSDRLSPTATGWLGIFAIILTVHFGVSNLLTATMWLIERPVRPLFDRPFASRSLSEFWSRRWNLPFVDMNRRLFMPAFRQVLPIRAAVVATFLVSGLLHEMAISYPAGGGWGGPFLYFALQGIATLLERRLKMRSRVWTWAWILLPLPLLFHSAFRETLIVPFFAFLRGVLVTHSFRWYFEMLLWSLGGMQLCVLMASKQVPKRLNWHEELPRLSPFNQKLMWTYAIFIVATVIAFAVLTLSLHYSFVAGEPAARGLAGFMGFFWWLRLSFDTFYYRSEDWPEGLDLQVGHALLNALFVYLALGYTAAAILPTFLSK